MEVIYRHSVERTSRKDKWYCARNSALPDKWDGGVSFCAALESRRGENLTRDRMVES